MLRKFDLSEKEEIIAEEEQILKDKKVIKDEFADWLKERVAPLIAEKAKNYQGLSLDSKIVKMVTDSSRRYYLKKNLEDDFGSDFQLLNLFISGLSKEQKHRFLLEIRGVFARFLSASKNIPEIDPSLHLPKLTPEELPIIESIEDIFALLNDQLYDILNESGRIGPGILFGKAKKK